VSRGRNLTMGATHRVAFLLLALLSGGLCAMAPERANAGEPCGGVVPSCFGGCPAGTQCGGVAGAPCECLQTCGDFASCGGGVCPAGFVCTLGATDCFCEPLPTSTPTITPTVTVTSTVPMNPVPATSTSGLAMGWLVLAAIGGLSLALRRRSSPPR